MSKVSVRFLMLAAICLVFAVGCIFGFAVFGTTQHKIRVPGGPYPRSYETLNGLMAMIAEQYPQSYAVFVYYEPPSDGRLAVVLLRLARSEDSETYAIHIGGHVTSADLRINGKPTTLNETLHFHYFDRDGKSGAISSSYHEGVPYIDVFRLRAADSFELRFTEDRRSVEYLNDMGEINSRDSPDRRSVRIQRDPKLGWTARMELIRNDPQ